MAFMWKRPETGVEEEVEVIGEAEHATDPGEHLHIRAGRGEFIVPAVQVRDDEEVEEFPIEVGSLWVDTDPRYPRRRVKIISEPDEGGWMTVVLVDPRGIVMPKSAVKERYTRFVFGDAFRPDDTGLPVVHDEEPEDRTGISDDDAAALAE